MGKPRLEIGIGECGVDLLVELVDDLRGCVPRRAKTEDRARLITRDELAYRREVRQRVRAGGRRDCESAQLAGPDIPDRYREIREEDLHLTTEEVGERGRHAAIGHMLDVEAAGFLLEQLGGDVRDP